ncbi:hypothetical protein HLB23_38215 [Nocardia uniformis]|uniref:Uncharacterized protein n=1 Tax=Nocardia uniformis TaxID=53432 RepID=A0A849C9W8_9NOCA|nr:hypothetical protein [Nocardia uniformis]NNH75623.1 hypothetical protein [Nocardia uniformis]
MNATTAADAATATDASGRMESGVPHLDSGAVRVDAEIELVSSGATAGSRDAIHADEVSMR